MVVNGSGWSIKNITGVHVNVSAWRPFRGGGDVTPNLDKQIHLQVPWQIRNSNCVVNLKSSQGLCFQYATACGAFYQSIKKNGKKPSNLCSYKNYLGKLNFQGLTFPLKHSKRNYELFEKLNPAYSLNILTLETDELYSRSKRLTRPVNKLLKKRKTFNINVSRTSPYLEDRIPLYILLLYNTKTGLSHYTTVTKLEVLLGHNSPTLEKGRSIICFKCKQRFCGDNRSRNFVIHQNYCLSDINTKNLSKSSYYRNLGDISDTTNKSVCLNCHNFYHGGTKKSREKYLRRHRRLCQINPPAIVKLPKHNIMTFDKIRTQRRAPFVMYCDTESVLCAAEEKKKIDDILKEYKKKLVDEEASSNTDENENLNLDFFSDDDESEGDDREAVRDDVVVELDDTPILSPDPPDIHTLHNHQIRLVD